MEKINFTSAQHVQIEFELAGVPQRFAAYLIDTIILSIYSFVAFMSIGLDTIFNDMGYWLLLVLILINLPWLFYQPVMEYFTGGQTLGKMALGFRIVKLNGDSVGFREVITRWFFRGDFLWLSGGFLVFFLPFWNTADGFFAIFSRKKQRIGDVLCGTIAIRNKSSQYYTLTDVLTIKNRDNHVITYPDVARFTDDDMMLVKNCILSYKRSPKGEALNITKAVSKEAATLLGLEEVPKPTMKFLETLLNDYVVLTR